MGTPTPWPVEGVPCPICWGAGKPFYSFASPKHIQVTVTGIIKGPDWEPPAAEPPNGMFELTEDGPCQWIGASAPWSFTVTYGAISTFFTIDHVLFLGVFVGSGLGCRRGVPNDFGMWIRLWAGGSASWTWLGGPK